MVSEWHNLQNVVLFAWTYIKDILGCQCSPATVQHALPQVLSIHYQLKLSHTPTTVQQSLCMLDPLIVGPSACASAFHTVVGGHSPRYSNLPRRTAVLHSSSLAGQDSPPGARPCAGSLNGCRSGTKLGLVNQISTPNELRLFLLLKD